MVVDNIPKVIFYLDDVGNPLLDSFGDDFYVWAKGAIEGEIVVNRSPQFDLWSLDFDLGRTLTGLDFLKWAAEKALDKWPKGRVIIHSHHPTGARKMREFVAKVEAELL